MSGRSARLASLLVAVALGLPGTASISAREHAAKPAFKYVGGTKPLPERCQGKLEMNDTAMTFACSDASVRIPYASVLFMQYRPDISHKVRKMKPRWKVKPQLFAPMLGGKENRYFTIVYQEAGDSPADTLVLEVSPDAMRPYLAEIDVKVGQRVEVVSQDDYD
jgi:hypothetical protein